MKIKLINYSSTELAPQRAHSNDAGADVFANIQNNNKIVIPPHSIRKIPLGFGIELPAGFVAYILPRSGMSANKGITAEVVPIDSGYTGEVHAILYNANRTAYTVFNGDKVAQLVIMPVVIADLTYEEIDNRGDKGFGSTGYK